MLFVNPRPALDEGYCFYTLSENIGLNKRAQRRRKEGRLGSIEDREATPFLLSIDTLNRTWVGRSRAPTGRPKIAQGNALGNMGRWMMEP
jgi:hypothetical protein